MNQEKTNRWLLIGAAVLAIVAGALVFAALANFGDDDDGSTAGSGSGPDVSVLVANQDISAGDQLDDDMFRTVTYPDSDVVTGAIRNAESIIGQTARTDIQKNQQLSQANLVQGASEEELREIMSSLVPQGQRAVGLGVDEVKIIGGHLIPGDYVDIIWNVREKDSPQSDLEFLRVETMFQDIEVMARTEHVVEGLVVVTDEAETVAPETSAPDDPRNTDVEHDAGSDVIVLKLDPNQLQTLQMMVDLGEITLSLRAFGDHQIVQLTPIRVPVYD